MGRLAYDRILKYEIEAVTRGPLHIGGYLGGTDEVLIDPKDNQPFIQASTLAGFLRSVSAAEWGDQITAELFGDSHDSNSEKSGNSRVKVTDGTMKPGRIKMELRPNVRIDRKTGTAGNEKGSGQKFETTYVSEGTEFGFTLYLYTKKEEPSQQSEFETVLGIMKADDAMGGNGARIGSKKSSGAGGFDATKIRRCIYDMTVEEDRKAWIKGDNPSTCDDILSELSPIISDCKYVIKVSAVTEGPIQVRGIAVNEFGSNAPDSENMTNGNNQFILPGSSIRGAIRSRMEMIADYMNKDQVIQNAFGYMADKHQDSRSGNLYFQDVLFKEKDQIKIQGNPLRHRIHIDKFTGGVMSRTLFSEKNASGETEIIIRILDRYDPDATLGLLLFALRDLASNLYNFGNGYATGKGFLKVSSIQITGRNTAPRHEEHANNVAEIRYGKENRILDESGMIKAALKSLNEIEGGAI